GRDDAVVEIGDLLAQPAARILARARVGDRRVLLRRVGLELLHLGDRREEVAAALLGAVNRLDVVEAVHDGLQLDLVLAQLLGHREHPAHAIRGAEHRALLRVLAGLDAHRDLDLALARAQRDLTHLAQIDAHGIVGGRIVDHLRGRRAPRRGPAARHHPDPGLADERAHLFEAVRAALAGQRGRHLFRGAASALPPVRHHLLERGQGAVWGWGAGRECLRLGGGGGGWGTWGGTLLEIGADGRRSFAATGGG